MVSIDVAWTCFIEFLWLLYGFLMLFYGVSIELYGVSMELYGFSMDDLLMLVGCPMDFLWVFY